ncbi:hypothetical protein GQ55_5G180700 [Panicum hallii var. hallii]|uniref:Uncharacterized protein n=1 Tax=Panicum hallii var. hallii TaxID=1504633 RepID=A0A2T7DHH6_9POAL|nr:hypothetical protein GQ55_5G180700 [Panicum hallii var. hallii]
MTKQTTVGHGLLSDNLGCRLQCMDVIILVSGRQRGSRKVTGGSDRRQCGGRTSRRRRNVRRPRFLESPALTQPRSARCPPCAAHPRRDETRPVRETTGFRGRGESDDDEAATRGRRSGGWACRAEG